VATGAIGDVVHVQPILRDLALQMLAPILADAKALLAQRRIQREGRTSLSTNIRLII
jgi:hypothetical protein